MARTALVISGGGSRGAFAVGAVDHLVNAAGLGFDLVVGTSTGALIAPMVATDGIARLKQIYTSVTTSDILTARPLVEAVFRMDALNDTAGLESLIRDDLDEARTRALLASDTKIALTTLNLNTGEVVYFHTAERFEPPEGQRAIRIRDRETLVRAVMASAYEPVFMPPVQVHAEAAGAPRIERADWYTDGGVREVAPIQAALTNGATDVYAIVLQGAAAARTERNFGRSGLASILERTVGLFVAEGGANDLAGPQREAQVRAWREALRGRLDDAFDPQQVASIFDALEDQWPYPAGPAPRITLIQPPERLPGSGLEFDPGEMAQIMLRGRERARDVLAAQPAPRPV